MPYLIDTDIIIYSLKNDTIVQDNFNKKSKAAKAISVISYGELIFGAKNSKQVDENLAIIFRIGEIFPIIDITRSVMETFGEIKARLINNGITIPDMDLLIGSTALTINYTIVTNNEKHFSKIPGLKIENWKKKVVE